MGGGEVRLMQAEFVFLGFYSCHHQEFKDRDQIAKQSKVLFEYTPRGHQARGNVDKGGDPLARAYLS